MIRSSTIIRELALNLAKDLKTFGEITSLFTRIIQLCGSMLPYNRMINNHVISPNVITYS